MIGLYRMAPNFAVLLAVTFTQVGIAQTIETHSVNTSIACGTARTPGTGVADELRATWGTTLTNELVAALALDSAISTIPGCDTLLYTAANLDNLDFLTGDNIHFGNAGNLMENDVFPAYFDTLQSQFGAYQATYDRQYIGSVKVSLIGGVICDGVPLCVGLAGCGGPLPNCPGGPDETLIVVGTADVAVYHVNASAEYTCNLPARN